MVIQSLPSPDEYTKTLGIEWNTGMDHLRITIARLPPLDNITKRMLVSQTELKPTMFLDGSHLL